MKMSIDSRVRGENSDCYDRFSGQVRPVGDEPSKFSLAHLPMIGHGGSMSTDRNTVDFLVDQLAAVGEVSAKAMFGEYGLYCDGKMVALICDGQLFIKPTGGGRAFAGTVDEAPPYPGAKACLLIDPDRWDDGDWLVELVRVTTAELPQHKPKSSRKSRPE